MTQMNTFQEPHSAEPRSRSAVIAVLGGSRKIFAHKAARTHHSPAYNQLLHYVAPTARAAGFQRKKRPMGRGEQTAAHPARRMTTHCLEPEKEGGPETGGEGGKGLLLSLGLPDSTLETVLKDLLQSRSYLKANFKNW